jgi:hypothetical protein
MTSLQRHRATGRPIVLIELVCLFGFVRLQHLLVSSLQMWDAPERPGPQVSIDMPPSWRPS